MFTISIAFRRDKSFPDFQDVEPTLSHLRVWGNGAKALCRSLRSVQPNDLEDCCYLSYIFCDVRLVSVGNGSQVVGNECTDATL